jgi:hypothetical protein
VLGALIIQTLTYAIYSLGVPPEINLVVKAVVVFVVCLVQSPGWLQWRPAPGPVDTPEAAAAPPPLTVAEQRPEARP